MQKFLTGYQLSDPTWLYLSFVLILAVYFKFSRVWSLRNLDLLLLLAISPGVLMLRSDDGSLSDRGTYWLMGALALGLLRVLLDGLFVRRPRLEQNMNVAGMSFLLAATVVFLTTKLLTDPLQDQSVRELMGGGEQRPAVVGSEPAAPVEDSPGDPRETAESEKPETPPGPTTALVKKAVDGISKVVVAGRPGSDHQLSDHQLDEVETFTVRGIAILSHLAVIVGLTLVGRQIFGDPDLGFAMSSLYILMPCTAYELASVTQVLPAALMVWGIYFYRSPFVSGSLLGLASGMVFFPVFLLPLWGWFYGRRGGGRFVFAVLLTTGLVVGALALLTRSSGDLIENTLGYVRWTTLDVWEQPAENSFWGVFGVAYRLPLLVSYILLVVLLTLWPREKSLAQLIPQTAAIVLGAQMWYPHKGGVYVLSYLPLLLLVVFRPMMTNHFAPEIKPLALFGRSQRIPAVADPAEASRV